MSKIRQMIPPSVDTFQRELYPSAQTYMYTNLYINRYAGNNTDIGVIHLAIFWFFD